MLNRLIYAKLQEVRVVVLKTIDCLDIRLDRFGRKKYLFKCSKCGTDMWKDDNHRFLKLRNGTISFMAHSEHGYLQAPKEAITKEQYEEPSSKIKLIDFDQILEGRLTDQECEGGTCPVK